MYVWDQKGWVLSYSSSKGVGGVSAESSVVEWLGVLAGQVEPIGLNHEAPGHVTDLGEGEGYNLGRGEG